MSGIYDEHDEHDEDGCGGEYGGPAGEPMDAADSGDGAEEELSELYPSADYTETWPGGIPDPEEIPDGYPDAGAGGGVSIPGGEGYGAREEPMPSGDEPEFEEGGESREGREEIPGYPPGDTETDFNAVEEDRFAPALSPGGQGEEEAGGGEAAFSTRQDDEPEARPYAAGKKAPGSVIKSKPGVLNRQLILYIAGGAAISGLIFATFILPLLESNTQKAEQKRRLSPAAVSPGDYASLVPRSDAGIIGGSPAPGGTENPETKFWEQDDEDIISSLPPIDGRFQSASPPPSAPARGSGGTGYARPDTRGDRLQAKTIPGIKGLTPSQSRYLSGPAQTSPAPADPDNPYAQFGMPPKEDYLAQMLSMQQQQYAAGSPSGYAAQNDQSGKTAFYNRGREDSGAGYWLSPMSVWQGTVFEAALTSRINTDLPGDCTAMVTKNVYSSQDGAYLLIPQNSRLLGAYNSSVSYSQKRVQVAWHTLIRPDGYYINLGNMQGSDPRGAAGLPGVINDHPFQYFKAVLLLSAMNIVNSELAYSAADTNNQYVQNVMANTQEMANALGGKIIDRALDVQPTITIKEGTRITIVVNNTLVLPPMTPYPVKHPYRRGQN
jgi:type IV secretion system protein VirB10